MGGNGHLAAAVQTGQLDCPERQGQLTPDLQLPGKMRLKESRRVPMWNGPIECRLFRFDMVQGAVRQRAPAGAPDAA